VNEIPSPRDTKTASGDATSFTAQTAVLLGALERHDEPTRSHSTNVATWSRRIANMLDLPLSATQFIERCALLHDVGKILTPKHILTKPGPLTADEWVRMKAHAAEGAALLEDIPALAGYAGVVRSHHEYYDGHGYPDSLSGHAIPFEARIIAVADAFDAMIGKRCYRASLAPTAAIAELQRCRGSQFEPAIVDCLVSILLPSGARSQGARVASTNG